MSRIRRAMTGAALGAAVGALVFLADLVGALLALASVFDPQWAAAVPILIAAATQVIAATTIGAIVGFAWPAARKLSIRRRPLAAGAATAALVIAVGAYLTGRSPQAPTLGPRPPPGAPNPESVLWITVDTLRADYVYGPNNDFPMSPALRRLADRALTFTDAEAGSGWTIPSLATLMTGIHPETLQSARRFVPDWAPTIAERMRAAGYETAALVDNAIVEKRNGFAQGFETWRGRSAARFAFALPGYRFLPLLARHWVREVVPIFYEGSPRVTDAALSVIGRPRTAPLFLYVHYMDPHYPYYPHIENGKEPDGGPWFSLAAARQRADSNVKPTPAQLALLTHRYAGEIRAWDRDLGRLVTAWQDRFGDDSVVMITGDHGDEFMEHGSLGHGHSLHRELVHVPLLVQPPSRLKLAVPLGTRIATPVGLVDVLPTTLEMLGLPPDVGADGIALQGISWLPWLDGRAAAPERPVFASQSHSRRRIYRWREGSWSRITTFEKNRDVADELFDLRSDPGELKNVIATEPEVLSAMLSHSEPFMRQQEAERDPRPVHGDDNAEALRALGYTQ